jgi:hypothetical protein
LAELKFAAEQTGASFEDVEKAIRTAEKNGFNPSQFDAIAKSISEIEDPARRTEAAMEVFGKSGAKLIPLLANLKELRQRARDLGLVPTDKAVEDADKIGDLFDQIKSVGKAAIFEIGAALAPVLIPALETIRSIGVGIARWARENAAIIQTVAKIIVGVTALGAGIAAAGAAIFALGTAIAAVATPLGATIALIAGGIAAWMTWTESGRETLSFLRETFTETWGGIVDAIMAGDLEAAGRIAWAGLMVVFQAGKYQLLAVWYDAQEVVMSTFDNLRVESAATIGYLSSLWTSFTSLLNIAFIGLSATFEGVWQAFKAGGVAAFDEITKYANVLIQAMNVVLIGFRKSIEEIAAVVPAVEAAVAAGALDGLKGSTGIDVRGILNAAQESADVAREQASRDANARGATREELARQGLDAQEQRIINAQKELADAAKAAAEARQKIEENRSTAKLKRPDIGTDVDFNKTAFTTFSAAALAAQGNGGALGVAKEHLKVSKEALENGKQIVEKLGKLQSLEFVA